MFRYRIRRRLEKSAEWFRGWFRAHVILPMYILTKRPIGDITFFQRRLPFIERHEYSQNGEDGIIAAVFAMIGTTNRSCVEFGVEDGMESNTRHLIVKKGWKGLLMDGSHEVLERRVHREFITTENIEDLFRKYHVPKEFDLLSIDIDGNDYWIWKAITTYRPRVVIIEYNAHLPPEESKTIPYDPAFVWDTTDYYGASLLALRKLGEAKGYTLLGTDRNGVNAFFVESSLVPGHFDPLLWPQTYHPPAFKGKAGNRHPKDPRNRGWVDV